MPGFDGAPGFIGMVAPLGTPPAVIRQLSSEIAAIVARPDVQAKIATLSVEPAYADEATFGAALVAESAKMEGHHQNAAASVAESLGLAA